MDDGTNRFVKGSALFIVFTGIVLLGYYGIDLYRHGVRSYEDWRTLRIVNSDASSIGRALVDGKISVGTSRSETDAIQQPLWILDRGRYVVYGYHPRGYSSRNVIFVDNLAVSAYASDCTWSWTYFSSEIPPSIYDSVHSYDQVRDVILSMPYPLAVKVADALQPTFDRACTVLGLPHESLSKLAEQTRAPEYATE